MVGCDCEQGSTTRKGKRKREQSKAAPSCRLCSLLACCRGVVCGAKNELVSYVRYMLVDSDKKWPQQ
jgi:hypothetical protein